MDEKPQPPDPDCTTCGGAGWLASSEVEPPATVKVSACHCNPDHLDSLD